MVSCRKNAYDVSTTREDLGGQKYLQVKSLELSSRTDHSSLRTTSEHFLNGINLLTLHDHHATAAYSESFPAFRSEIARNMIFSQKGTTATAVF